jgi:hypothetical protein
LAPWTCTALPAAFSDATVENHLARLVSRVLRWPMFFSQVETHNGSRKWYYGYRLSAIGYRLSAIGYRLSAVGYRLSAIGCRLSAVADWSLEPGAWDLEPG